ncbi:MAG: excinuclease ABC subunit UvrA [Tissierellia bacterium]|nr:excinuclease ABC subunit UvrA [Tissierellia bacterium]
MQHENIIIKGAKVHNLKNIDLKLPRNKLIVFTGLSGSGKSTLAFDTIYAEGQRRYVESLSSYARQFLGQMEKPDVEYIEGLSPSISIDQKTTSKNPRSTVGTVTEIYDYLRLLFARVGTPYCPVCGEKIKSQSVDQMVDQITSMKNNTKFMVLSPIIRGQKGEHAKTLDYLRKEGFVRAVIDGEVLELSDSIKLEKNKRHTIEVVVDRLINKEGVDGRLAGSLETALALSDGLVIISIVDGEKFILSSKLACPNGHISMEEISPRLFSFNSPFGACETCKGIGFSKHVDPELVIPNKKLSIAEGAISPYGTTPGTYYFEIIKEIAKKHNFSINTPIERASKELIDNILFGSKETIVVDFTSHYSGRKKYEGPFEGVIPNLERRYFETASSMMRDSIESYMTEVSCPACKGQRLKPEVLSIRFGELNIAEFTDLSVNKAIEYLSNVTLTKTEKSIAKMILNEINNRLKFLQEVGLSYITLSRMTGTLSGGEAQRIRLATQIGSSLVGVVYVLDEPSIGLHQRDNAMLLKTLRNLTDIGNTLIVVEHDEDTIRSADEIVDIGPGAGIHGGEIVAQGTVADIEASENSETGAYLSGRKLIEIPSSRRIDDLGKITIKGARENNLKNIDVEFPLGKFIAVTGVSGSGKSTLVNQILYRNLANQFNKTKLKPGDHDSIEGIEAIDKVVVIDQSPIGRTPRSNPATYTGVFDFIRDIFSITTEAKMRGYSKGRFSFNVKGGRCESCKGDGIIKVEMHFLPDVYVPCEVCKGKRYNRETLQIKYKNKNISDVLEMTVEEGLTFFENVPRIKRKFQTLFDVGLGYIKIGQPSTQLSGGEAQRVKLATELSKRATGRTIYILDEPTTGLHSADIHKLIHVLNKLVDNGNTVIVIEHNLDVIKTCDYIVDLGPEGGDYGGTVVATGTPEEVANSSKSYTGEFLKPLLFNGRKDNG